MSERATSDAVKCWPCAIANATVGLLVGWLPLGAALVRGDAVFVYVSGAWGIAVTGYTAYRIASLGYLPLAEPVARLTGLHERIGPGSKPDADREE